MEEKKYEAGRVEISSTEYRDLVTEAVEALNKASQEMNKRCELERELYKTKVELENTRNKVCELENLIQALRSTAQSFCYPNPALSTVKEDI